MEDIPVGEKVICKNCEKEVVPTPNPKGKGPDICPKCHTFMPSKKVKQKKQAAKGDGKFNFNLGIGTGLNSQEMQLVENLVNTGVGDSPAEVLKKGVYALASGYNIGGVNMTNGKTDKKEEMDPLKQIDEMQAREGRDIALQRMQDKIKKGDALDPKEIMDMVKTKQALKMLGDMDQGDGSDFNIKDMMQLQMLQSFTPNQNNDGNQPLLQQVKDLQQQLSEQKQDSRYSELMNKIDKLGQGKSGGEDITALKETMLEIEKIRSAGRTELEKSKQSNQEEIEKRKAIELDHKLAEIDRKSQEIVARSQGSKGISKGDIADIKETISAAKDLAKELGGEGQKQGKDAGELVTDVINKTIENLTPIAKKYMEDKAAQGPQPGSVYTEPPQPANPDINIPPQQPPVEPVYTEPPQPDPAYTEPTQPPLSSEEDMANMMHQQQSSSEKKKTK